nr:MAG: hypothetical protein 1 [Leviviridae sp.]
MVTRTRSREGPLVGGTRTLNGVTGTQYYVSSSETVEDVVGQGDNQPFVVSKWLKEGGQFSGSVGSYSINGYAASIMFSTGTLTTPVALPTANYATLASQLLMRTTPNRSSSQILASLAELGELPSLVRDSYANSMERMFKRIPPKAFRTLDRLAKRNLMVQFGLMPMISDLNMLLKFQALVDQRVSELEKLRTRGLRRTITLQTDSGISQFDNTNHSNGWIYVSTMHRRTTRVIRGHVRWTLQSNFVLSEANMRSLAARTVTGNKLDPLTLYELFPWSWFIDYFTNLNHFVKLSRNIIPCTHSTPRMMVHTETTLTSSNGRSAWPNLTMTPIKSRSIRKERFARVASLAAHRDFLSKSQMSILGSLAILKGRKNR